MDAVEYLKKAIEICKVFDLEGQCYSECPLKGLNCGIPTSSEDQLEAIRIVEEFTIPQNYICPQCQNKEHADDAKYCKICGLKIGGEKS